MQTISLNLRVAARGSLCCSARLSYPLYYYSVVSFPDLPSSTPFSFHLPRLWFPSFALMFWAVWKAKHPPLHQLPAATVCQRPWNVKKNKKLCHRQMQPVVLGLSCWVQNESLFHRALLAQVCITVVPFTFDFSVTLHFLTQSGGDLAEKQVVFGSSPYYKKLPGPLEPSTSQPSPLETGRTPSRGPWARYWTPKCSSRSPGGAADSFRDKG